MPLRCLLVRRFPSCSAQTVFATTEEADHPYWFGPEGNEDYPKVLKKVGKAPEQYGSWADEEDS